MTHKRRKSHKTTISVAVPPWPRWHLPSAPLVRLPGRNPRQSAGGRGQDWTWNLAHSSSVNNPFSQAAAAASAILSSSTEPSALADSSASVSRWHLMPSYPSYSTVSHGVFSRTRKPTPHSLRGADVERRRVRWRKVQHVQDGRATQIGALAHGCVGECEHVVLPGDVVLNLIDAMAEPRQPPALHHRGHALLGNAEFSRLRSGYYAVVVFGHRPDLFI